MASADALERGRDAVRRRAWREAYDRLAAADGERPLAAADLERLAVAAQLSGRDAAVLDLWARAHHERLRAGDAAGAAGCACQLAFRLFHQGEMARGGGWLARARRLIDEPELDCVERGYLLLADGRQRVARGDPAAALATFGQAGQIGARFRDLDLETSARLGQGRSLIDLGRIADGVALLDEAMVAVTADEVSPIVAGIVYCAVIQACHQIFDLRRAQEWTAALGQWCDAQPGLVPFRGECLVHRVEILQRRGAWPDAMAEARLACQQLSEPTPQPPIGAAFYEMAELHRLRGEVAEAEEGYRQASRWRHEPQPGLALLRLAQGQLGAAEAAIRRAVDEAPPGLARARLLPARVEIALAADDAAAARTAADELGAVAAEVDAPLLRAAAAQAAGAVLLAEREAMAALEALRRAGLAWQELEAPYESARVRVLIALACRALGDRDGAALELDAAAWALRQLGAGPDLARVEALSAPPEPPAAFGLTGRELEVLRLVSAGKTNRAIAGDLVLSEKTVARHVSNILGKLDLPSRAAATAYAYEHHLV